MDQVEARRGKLLDLLTEISGVERTKLEPTMNLIADVGLDSAKALRLLAEIEEEFSIEIEDEDAERMSTVGDLLDYVESLA